MNLIIVCIAVLAMTVPSAKFVHAQSGSSTTATGTSREFNPAISVNSLFLASWRDPASEEDGFKAQEIELAMSAVVDPYFTADAFIAYEPDAEGPHAHLALEEIFGPPAGGFELVREELLVEWTGRLVDPLLAASASHAQRAAS